MSSVSSSCFRFFPVGGVRRVCFCAVPFCGFQDLKNSIKCVLGMFFCRVRHNPRKAPCEIMSGFSFLFNFLSLASVFWMRS